MAKPRFLSEGGEEGKGQHSALIWHKGANPLINPQTLTGQHPKIYWVLFHGVYKGLCPLCRLPFAKQELSFFALDEQVPSPISSYNKMCQNNGHNCHGVYKGFCPLCYNIPVEFPRTSFYYNISVELHRTSFRIFRMNSSPLSYSG